MLNSKRRGKGSFDIEIAGAGSSRFWSVLPKTVQSDPFEKVPSMLDQINYDSKATKKDSWLARNETDSRPVQLQPDPLPRTTQMIHLVAKTSQLTMVKDGTSVSRFAPEAAVAKMQMNKAV